MCLCYTYIFVNSETRPPYVLVLGIFRCREDEEEDGPDEMKAKEIKVESNGDGEKDATVEVDHIEAHRDGKETNSEV